MFGKDTGNYWTSSPTPYASEGVLRFNLDDGNVNGSDKDYPRHVRCVRLKTPKTPNGMYVYAGQLERQGKASEARSVYEQLVAQFPDSAAAMKATDRLHAMRSQTKNAEATSRASEAAQSQARRQCRTIYETCMAQCAGVSNKGYQQADCDNRCERAKSSCLE